MTVTVNHCNYYRAAHDPAPGSDPWLIPLDVDTRQLLPGFFSRGVGMERVLSDNDSLPMMPWFPDSFIGGTFAWELDEIGLYHNLLCAQWLGGPLLNDPLKLPLYGRCTPAAFERAWPKVRSKFTETPAGLVNERLEQHRVKSLNLKKRASAGGQATAKVRAKPPAKPVLVEPLKDAHLISLSLSLSGSPSQQKTTEGNGAAEEVKTHSTLPIEAWNEWLTLRRKRKWPMDPVTLRKQLKVLEPHATEVQRGMIETSINAGWQGIFPPKGMAPAGTVHKRAPTVAELEERERAKR